LLVGTPVEIGGDVFRMLVGYRYFDLEESIRIDVSQAFADPSDPDLTATTRIRDTIAAGSEFHEVELRVATNRQRGRYGLEVILKAAVGNMNQILEIRGQTESITPTEMVTINTGQLATVSNIGRFSRDRFAGIPQLRVSLHCAVRRMILFAGYSLRTLPQVVRAGEHVPTEIDPLATDPAHVRIVSSTMWVQGMNLGVQW
jgi:hypothetical protein